jgi:hypothetical protein
MLCPSCSNPIVPGSRFCTHCGAHLSDSATPPPPAPYSAFTPLPRVQRHLQTVGILWFVYGAYRVVTALIAILVLRVMTFRSFGNPGWPFFQGGPGFTPGWMAALAPVLAIVTLIGTALAFFVGYSLLQRKPWGRTLAIVAAVLILFKPLLGTALGIYTLWLLAPSASGFEYDAVADRA